ncbi:hypothetical protein D3C81_1985960 [compost metagenome]
MPWRVAHQFEFAQVVYEFKRSTYIQTPVRLVVAQQCVLLDPCIVHVLSSFPSGVPLYAGIGATFVFEDDDNLFAREMSKGVGSVTLPPYHPRDVLRGLLTLLEPFG